MGKKVKDLKLLIEYVFLLTQGELIEENLAEQIKHINKEKDRKIKIEILKFISVANLCNIQLNLDKILDY
ncbi:MAG: hypothetical protein U0354_20385 [Candidatus Sericytochromatia bacterium]